MKPDILTKKQAAEYLQTTTRTIERLAASGRLRVSKITAGLWRVRQNDLDALLDGSSTLKAPSKLQEMPPVPPPIGTVSDIRVGFVPAPVSSGVYFAWDGEEVVYVGRAKNLRQRICQRNHHVLKDGDRISLLAFNETDAPRSEYYYTSLLNPSRNKFV